MVYKALGMGTIIAFIIQGKIGSYVFKLPILPRAGGIQTLAFVVPDLYRKKTRHKVARSEKIKYSRHLGPV